MPADAPKTRRSAGVLLHPTSLPASDLGADAYRFVDYLARAGQSAWQMMPLGPPGPGHSPYASRSAFAGDPLLISLDHLAERGWLTHDEAASADAGEAQACDFDAASKRRAPLLRGAYERAMDRPDCRATLGRFAASHPWLHAHGLFAALRETSGKPWWEWDAAFRQPESIREYPESSLGDEVRFHEFLQWCFDEQWHALRDYARSRGIRIIGDLPIFVDLDSADAWANQRLFKFREPGKPDVVAGVPPDAFSDTGQRWGNPLYDWNAMREDGYGWWVERLRRTFDLFDAVRIDHFRGFEAAWEIPAHEPTAERGHWEPGPGRDLFDKLEAELGRLPIIVEDLGLITQEVRDLRDELGYPGMSVLHFAFGDTNANPYLPHNHLRNSVVFTGTHDNDTTLGWWGKLSDWERGNVQRYLGRDGSDITSDLIRLAYASVAETAIVPMQDILGLGSEARMNFPGQADGNWRWRFEWSQVDERRTAWLAEVARTFGRTAPAGE